MGKSVIWRVIRSLLASFIGVQSRKNMTEEVSLLEKHGFALFIVMGFALAIFLHLILYAVVVMVLPAGASWSIF